MIGVRRLSSLCMLGPFEAVYEIRCGGSPWWATTVTSGQYQR
jgi:hypothetical protein